MRHINIGWNGDPELPKLFNDINSQYSDARISSVYGSTRAMSFLSARPDFRLPNVSDTRFKDAIQAFRDVDIDFNYTCNAPYLGNKREIDFEQARILNHIEQMIEFGVHRFIISNPVLLDLMHRSFSGSFRAELSTIMHIDTVMQLEAFKNRYPEVDRVCGNMLKNRDFQFLCNANEYCQEVGMTYELLANEFCATGDVGGKKGFGATHCIYRDSCYSCHSSNITQHDASSLHGYPMGNCMFSRSTDAVDWLRTPAIHPAQQTLYTDVTGIHHFKVTGRTGGTPYLVAMAHAYLSGKWNQNLLSLWKPLETIYSGKDELEHKHRHEIPCTETADGSNIMTEFLLPWVAGKLNCINYRCINCMYCDKFYKDNMDYVKKELL